MTTRSTTLLLAAALLAVTATAGSGADQVCLAPSDAWGCFLCDLPIPMNATGFTTAGSPCTVSIGYGGRWTVSASDQDPYVNQGPLGFGNTTLYLWLAAAGCGYGFSNGEIVLDSDVPIVSYTPVASGYQSWFASPDGTHATLSAGLSCTGPTVVGELVLSRVGFHSVPTDGFASPSDIQDFETWGRVKALYR